MGKEENQDVDMRYYIDKSKELLGENEKEIKVDEKHFVEKTERLLNGTPDANKKIEEVKIKPVPKTASQIVANNERIQKILSEYFGMPE